MSPQKQRVAIAKACGWTCPKGRPDLFVAPGKDTEDWCFTRRFLLDELPDYLNDLNAMHKAEKALMGEGIEDESWAKWDAYRKLLDHAVGSDCTFHTTAAQRAEAFLRCLGLWMD